jgi:hypothetical protein
MQGPEFASKLWVVQELVFEAARGSLGKRVVDLSKKNQKRDWP